MALIVVPLVSPGGFREMSNLTPETVIQGKVYLIWVKDTGGYTDPDAMYGVAYKGNSRFGHQDFTHVCKNRNGKVFYSKCINDGQFDPCWQECLEAMEVEKAPIGSPRYLTDRAYTFAEVAKIAYEEKFFTDQEGLQHLAKKTAPPKSAKVKKIDVEAAKILGKAKTVSDELDKEKNTGFPNSPFLPSLLPANNLALLDSAETRDQSIIIDGQDDDESDEDNEKIVDENGKDLETLKKIAQAAEAKMEEVLKENKSLRLRVTELTAKLDTSMEEQKKFMVTADNATMTLEAMNDDTATKVIKKIDPKLSKIPALDTNVNAVLAKLAEIGGAISNIPFLVGKQLEPILEVQLGGVHTKIDGVGASMDSSCESLSEGLLTVEATLSAFGMDEGEDTVDIPSSIKHLVEVARGAGTNAPDNQAPGQGSHSCRYAACSMPAVYACKCGCGSEVHGAPGNSPGALVGGNAQGIAVTPQENMDQTITLTRQQVSFTPDAKQLTASGSASRESSAYLAPPIPFNQYNLAPASTPGSDAGSEQNLVKQTRKERRLARIEEFKEKKASRKLEFGQYGHYSDTSQRGNGQPQRFSNPAQGRQPHQGQRFSNPAQGGQQYPGQRFSFQAQGGQQHQGQRFSNPAQGGQQQQLGQRFSNPAQQGQNLGQRVAVGVGQVARAPTLPNWGGGILQNPNVWEHQYGQGKQPY